MAWRSKRLAVNIVLCVLLDVCRCETEWVYTPERLSVCTVQPAPAAVSPLWLACGTPVPCTTVCWWWHHSSDPTTAHCYQGNGGGGASLRRRRSCTISHQSLLHGHFKSDLSGLVFYRQSFELDNCLCHSTPCSVLLTDSTVSRPVLHNAKRACEYLIPVKAY